jgi:hypothetical protein
LLDQQHAIRTPKISKARIKEEAGGVNRTNTGFTRLQGYIFYSLGQPCN